ncbi:Sulfurtransferase TusA [compost metagenome]
MKNLTGGYKTYQISKYVPQNKNTASNEKLSVTDNLNADAVIDACGLCCPGPIIQVKKSIDLLQEGQILKVTASDQGFFEDIKAWAKLSRNSLVQLNKLTTGTIEAYLRKGNIDDASISKS